MCILMTAYNRKAKQIVRGPMSKEKQYWAKGTGFGTGSTSSYWDVGVLMEQQRSEELMVSVCCGILGGWLAPPQDAVSYDDVFTAGVVRILSESCLLPAIASYLTNDSSEGECERVKVIVCII